MLLREEVDEASIVIGENELTGKLMRLADDELKAGAEEFMGLPDRWYEKPGPKWRCRNGHVSTMYLKSERLGGNVCLAGTEDGPCREFVHITFPEDEDGELLL